MHVTATGLVGVVTHLDIGWRANGPEHRLGNVLGTQHGHVLLDDALQLLGQYVRVHHAGTDGLQWKRKRERT